MNHSSLIQFQFQTLMIFNFKNRSLLHLTKVRSNSKKTIDDIYKKTISLIHSYLWNFLICLFPQMSFLWLTILRTTKFSFGSNLPNLNQSIHLMILIRFPFVGSLLEKQKFPIFL